MTIFLNSIVVLFTCYLQVAKPETLLLIILNLVCKSDIKEANFVVFNPSLKKNVRWQKHTKEDLRWKM